MHDVAFLSAQTIAELAPKRDTQNEVRDRAESKVCIYDCLIREVQQATLRDR